MRKTLDSLAACLSGGVQPHEIAVAAFLGLLAGFLAGANAGLLAMLLLAAVLNVSTRAFLGSWLAGLALAWVLTPVTYHLGYVLLERSPLRGWLAATGGESLGVVLLDLDRYTLLGGLGVGLCLAIAAATIASRTARALWQPATDSGRLARLARWCCYGRLVPAAVAVAPRTFRPLAPVLLLAGGLLAVALAWDYAPQAIHRHVMRQIVELNGARAEAAGVSYRWSAGVIEIADLRLIDPRRPNRRRAEVGRLLAVVRPGPLLRGRLEVERLVLEEVRSGGPRRGKQAPLDSALQVFNRPAAGEDVAPPASAGVPLESFVRDWPALRERTARLRDMALALDVLLPSEPLQRANAARGVAPLGYAQMRSLRSSLGQPRPQAWLKRVRVRALPAEWGLSETACLDIADLATGPAVAGRPVQIRLADDELKLELAVELARGAAKHRLTVDARDVDLAALVDSHKTDQILSVHGGRAQIRGQGWYTRDALHLPLDVEFTDLDLDLAADATLAGIPVETLQHGLAQGIPLAAVAVLSGTWHVPALALDEERLARACRAARGAAQEADADSPGAAKSSPRVAAGRPEVDLQRSIGASPAATVDEFDEPAPLPDDIAEGAILSDDADAARGRYPSHYDAADDAPLAEDAPRRRHPKGAAVAEASAFAGGLRYPDSFAPTIAARTERPASLEAPADAPADEPPAADPPAEAMLAAEAPPAAGPQETAPGEEQTADVPPAYPEPVGFQIGYDDEALAELDEGLADVALEAETESPAAVSADDEPHAERLPEIAAGSRRAGNIVDADAMEGEEEAPSPIASRFTRRARTNRADEVTDNEPADGETAESEVESPSRWRQMTAGVADRVQGLWPFGRERFAASGQAMEEPPYDPADESFDDAGSLASDEHWEEDDREVEYQARLDEDPIEERLDDAPGDDKPWYKFWR